MRLENAAMNEPRFECLAAGLGFHWRKFGAVSQINRSNGPRKAQAGKTRKRKKPAVSKTYRLIDNLVTWWEMQVSNLRPLQCECSALPLS